MIKSDYQLLSLALIVCFSGPDRRTVRLRCVSSLDAVVKRVGTSWTSDTDAPTGLVMPCQDYVRWRPRPLPPRGDLKRCPRAAPRTQHLRGGQGSAPLSISICEHVLHKTSRRSCEGQLQQNADFTRKMPVDGGIRQKPGREESTGGLRGGGSGAGRTHQPHQSFAKDAQQSDQRRLRQHPRSLQEQRKHRAASQPAGLQTVCS